MREFKSTFKLNNSGKSPALYLKKNINFLSKKKIYSLFDMSSKYNNDARICLHSDKNSKLQVMIIVLRPQNKKYYYNYHPNIDEYYFMIEGELLVKYLKNNKKVKVVLSKKNNPIFKMKKKVKHVTIPLSKKCMFLEIRDGKFIANKDAVFLKKYEKIK